MIPRMEDLFDAVVKMEITLHESKESRVFVNAIER